MAISKFQRTKDTPATLQELIRKSSKQLWPKYLNLKDATSNLHDADEIMGRPKLNEINTVMIDDYIATVSQGIKPSTVNRKLSNLHKILKHAFEREWLDRMPKFTWQPERNERVRWLTQEEEAQLLSLLPPKVSAFCEILIHTGMRRGELLKLQPKDVDGDYARLWVTKTGKPRSVPLTDRAKELMAANLPFNMDINHIHREWLKAKEAMGLAEDKDFVLHMLRHTTATRLLDTTGNIVVVQKMLGHSKIATTLRYAHLSDEGLLDSIRLTAQKYQNAPVSA